MTRGVLDQGVPAGGYLLVTDPKLKKIIAAIGVRRLRPSQLDDLKTAAEAVIFVPWSARVSQVWDQLNEEQCSVAVVVNEFGEAIGALSTDDILRVVLAPRRGREEVDEASIQELAGDRYRVNGSASLRVLAKRLSLEIPEEGVATVAGYIQRHNERRPRKGDRAVLGRFELTVTEVHDSGIWIEVQPASDDCSDVEGHRS